jgi:hypothetical protein
MATPHDSLFKATFSEPEHALSSRLFFQTILPP